MADCLSKPKVQEMGWTCGENYVKNLDEYDIEKYDTAAKQRNILCG